MSEANDNLPGQSRALLIPMHAAMFAIVAIVVLVAYGMARADERSDLAPLQEYVEAYDKAWDTHNPTALAAFFSEDSDMVFGSAPGVHGQKAIEAWWRTYFDAQEPDRLISIRLTSARHLTPLVAVVNVETTTGGGTLPARDTRGTWLLRQQDGQWQIAAMRGLPTESDQVKLKASQEAAEALRPQIRAFVAAYEDTFNRHDTDALAAFYRQDAEIIVRNDAIVQGGQSILDWWRQYFSQPRPYRALMIIEEIRMIESDVALLNVIGTGAPNNATIQPNSVRYARATWLLVREEGRWLIAALRVLPSDFDQITRATDPES